jgi:hypothetical protein
MSKVDEIAEIAADGVADGMHIVSEEALAAEKVVRAFDNVRLAYLGLGIAIGGAVGSVIAFRVAYRKAELKYAQISADEIDEMRQNYFAKGRALEAQAAKKPVEDLVKERGYSSPDAETSAPPLAVSPPQAVVDAAEAAQDDFVPSPDDPIVKPATPEREARNIFRDNPQPQDEWDEHKERASRSPLKPYVVHVDERDAEAAYESVTYTYYEADDVLCNERDEVIAGPERDNLVGEMNLDKFGHGSNDANIVYIRNDSLEMDMEIVRSPNSYAEEVHGFEPPEPELRHAVRRGRHSIDDE